MIEFFVLLMVTIVALVCLSKSDKERARNAEITQELPIVRCTLNGNSTICDLLPDKKRGQDTGLYYIAYQLGSEIKWLYIDDNGYLQASSAQEYVARDLFYFVKTTSNRYYLCPRATHTPLVAQAMKLVGEDGGPQTAGHMFQSLPKALSADIVQGTPFTLTQTQSGSTLRLSFDGYNSNMYVFVTDKGVFGLADDTANVFKAYNSDFQMVLNDGYGSTVVSFPPNININGCKDDCVTQIQPVDGGYICSYNLNNFQTADNVRKFASKSCLSDLSQAQKDLLCSNTKLVPNPFEYAELCGEDVSAKDAYCTASISNMFSPDCLDYIKNGPESAKTEIRTIFADKLDEICPKIKAGIVPNPAPSNDIMDKVKNTCNCVLTDAEKKQAIDKMRQEYDDDGQYLNTLFSKPVNCWFDKCLPKNVPLLKNYTDCGDLIYCVEKIDIDAGGDIAKIDISQSEACKNIIKKKDAGGGGSGGGGAGRDEKPAIWLWVSLGSVFLVVLIVLIIKRLTTHGAV